MLQYFMIMVQVQPKDTVRGSSGTGKQCIDINIDARWRIRAKIKARNKAH